MDSGVQAGSGEAVRTACDDRVCDHAEGTGRGDLASSEFPGGMDLESAV